MTTLKTIKLVAISLLFIGLTSCDSDEPEQEQGNLETKTIENFHAPGDIRDHTTGQVIEERAFHYFSFSTAGEVAVTDDWDIAFKGSTIITNSGIHGNSQAAATIETSTLSALTEAPNDDDFSIDTAISNAIPLGSGHGWYTYSMTTHRYTPIAGKIIVVRTHDGKYAKMEIINYYKTVEPNLGEGGNITFNYVYQPNGTKDF